MGDVDKSPRLETISLSSISSHDNAVPESTIGTAQPHVPAEGSPGPRRKELKQQPGEKLQRRSTWKQIRGDAADAAAAKLATARWTKHLEDEASNWVPSQRTIRERGSERSEPLCLAGRRPTYLIARRAGAGLCVFNLDDCKTCHTMESEDSAMPWALCACEFFCCSSQQSWFSKGVLVASGHTDGTVAIWSVSNQELLCRFAGPTFARGKIYCAASVPSVGRLLTGSSTKHLRVWSVSEDASSLHDMEEVHCINTDAGGEVWACCAIPIGDGSIVFASCHSSGRVMLWNSVTYAQLGQIEMHFQDHVSAYCAAQSDRLVVNSSVGVRVFRLNVRDNENSKRSRGSNSKPCLHRLVGRGKSAIHLQHHEDAHFEVTLARRFGTFSPCCVVVDDDTIISTESMENPGTLSFWSFSRGACTRSLTGTEKVVTCVSAYECGILVTHREEQTMHVWNLHSQGMHSMKITHGVTTVLPLSQGKRLLAAGARGTEYIYTVGPRSTVGQQIDVAGTVSSSTLLQVRHHNSDEETCLIACGCEAGFIVLHEDTTFDLVQKLEGHGSSAVHCMTTVNKGTWLVSGAEDGGLIVWKPGRIHSVGAYTHILNKYGRLAGHTQPVWCCCEVIPDSILASTVPCVVSGSADKMVIIWDCEACVQLATLPGHDKAVWTCCALNKSSKLVTGSADETLKIWKLSWSTPTVEHGGFVDHPNEDAAQGTVKIPPGVTNTPGEGYSPSFGQQLTSLSCKASQVEQLVGHRGEVRSSIALNDDQWVLSGSPLDCLRLWEVSSGNQIHTFPLQAQWNGIHCMPSFGDIPTPCSAFVLTRSTFQNACFILDLSAGENRMPNQAEVWECYVKPDRRSKTLTETKNLIQQWPGKVLIEPDQFGGNFDRTLIHRAVEEDDVELLECMLTSSPGISVFCGEVWSSHADNYDQLRTVLGMALRFTNSNSASCTELLVEDIGIALQAPLEDHEAVRESIGTESMSLRDTLALCRVYPELFLQLMRILKPRRIDGRRQRRVMAARQVWILGSELMLVPEFWSKIQLLPSWGYRCLAHDEDGRPYLSKQKGVWQNIVWTVKYFCMRSGTHRHTSEDDTVQDSRGQQTPNGGHRRGTVNFAASKCRPSEPAEQLLIRDRPDSNSAVGVTTGNQYPLTKPALLA